MQRRACLDERASRWRVDVPSIGMSLGARSAPRGGMMDEATFYAEAWHRFLAVGQVRSAFADAAFASWTPERRYLTILVDLSHAVALSAAAAEIAAGVESPVYGLVGRDGLHLTVQEIGFADRFGPGDLATIEQAVARVAAETACFQATVTGVGSFADAAFFQVEPWAPFRALRRQLWAACPLLRGHGPSADVPAAEGGLAPHVSIAYYNATAPAAAIADRLARYRGLALPPFAVEALSLVVVRPPTHPYFQWEVLRRVPLAPVPPG
jgi:2'-5' RNA ligase superfamily protein